MKEKNYYLVDYGYKGGEPYIVCEALEEEFVEVKEVSVDEDLLDQ